MNEFELIKKYFFKKPNRDDVITGNGDDCAIVKASTDCEIAMSMDTLVSDVHFDKSFSAENIGYKSLAVNLSDLAAVGATPAWVMLSLTLPAIDESFLKGFQTGFFEHFQNYSMNLIGGDITQGPLSITIQVSGLLPKSSAILRSSAAVGDKIYVTHEVGDAVLALRYLQKEIQLSDHDAEKILPRLYRPTPRINEGIVLRDYANSMIDISDGLYGDLQHILNASQVGATINVDQIPVSSILKKQSTDIRRVTAVHCGDSYELCFTASKKLPNLPFKITCIGEITQKLGIELRDDKGDIIAISGNSFQHFAV